METPNAYGILDPLLSTPRVQVMAIALRPHHRIVEVRGPSREIVDRAEQGARAERHEVVWRLPEELSGCRA
jgi:hypothetical protein